MIYTFRKLRVKWLDTYITLEQYFSFASFRRILLFCCIAIARSRRTLENIYGFEILSLVSHQKQYSAVFFISFALLYSNCMVSSLSVIQFLYRMCSKCFIKTPFPSKAFTQCLHLYDFSSECIFKCYLRSHIGDKVFAHCLH